MRALLRSRSNQQRRAKRLRRELQALKEENEQLRHELKRAEELRQIQSSMSQQLPPEPNQASLQGLPIRGHQFVAKMIALCIDLGLQIGFRAAERTLIVLARAWNWDIKVPSHSTIRNWASRMGVGELEDSFGKNEEALWMADHSSQVGAEKVLLIAGLLVKDLPKPGETLCADNIKVLAIVPGRNWKKEDVAREYKRLAERIGAPRYLLCDGATELSDPAALLEEFGRKPIVLGDLKHHAANVLEKQIGRSERFKSFMSQVGLTRNRIQQTELSHFMPPPLKQKSRFMNLAPILRWARMVIHHLNNPDGEARKGITSDRMNEKLGWLLEYRDDLGAWSACQDVIDVALAFINREGLSHGTSERMRQRLQETMRTQPDQQEAPSRVAACLVQFVQQSEQKLEAGQRAWLSTEILESLFGQFKQLEGQHSKGGFTSLLAAFPALCCSLDPERVRRRMLQVPTTKLKQWVKDHLGQTMTGRRITAYREAAVMAV
jgi:hypothetical protein